MAPIGGINVTFLLAQLVVPLIFFGGWFLLAVAALVVLRNRELPETARALWTFLIVLVPLLGAAAFFVVQPGESDRQREIPAGQRR